MFPERGEMLQSFRGRREWVAMFSLIFGDDRPFSFRGNALESGFERLQRFHFYRRTVHKSDHGGVAPAV